MTGDDRRSIAIVDVETGRVRRNLVLDLRPEDQIQDFAVNPAGTRVLVTTGGERNDLRQVEGFARPETGWRRWFRHWVRPSLLKDPEGAFVQS